MKQIKRITLIAVLLITTLLQGQTKVFNSQVRIKQVPLSSSLDSLVTINSDGLLTYLPKSDLSSGGALEFITEGGNTGIAIKGRNPDNYGDIGEGAVDLSFSNSVSSTKGAIGARSLVSGTDNSGGINSIVAGGNNIGGNNSLVSGTGNSGGNFSLVSGRSNISGLFSLVSGFENVVGDNSLASGEDNTAGDFALISGENNFAPSYAESTLGMFGTNYTPNSTTTYNADDRLFSLANGINDTSRSDALTVYKSGNATLNGDLTVDNIIGKGSQLTNVNSNEVENIDIYGAVNDGVTDNKTAFINALNQSKISKKPIYIPYGDYIIVHNDVNSIDMTGCVGIIGDGTLIFEVPESDNPTLEWEGQRELITGSDTFVKGEKSHEIQKNKDIKIGDTVFLISTTDVISSNQSKKYNKGQRLTVVKKEIGATLDTLFFEEELDGMTNAYLVWNSDKPKVYVKGVTIKANVPSIRKGIRFTLCDVEISNVKVFDFQKYCVNIASSKSIITDLTASANSFVGTGTSYGLQISGLSDSVSYRCELNGGRHGLAHSDNGYWNADFFGLATEFYFLSSNHTIRDSNISSEDSSASLDTHRNTNIFKAINCTIYNGAVLGGVYNYLEKCVIYSGTRGTALTFGRSAIDITIPHGKVKIVNSEVRGDGYAILNSCSMESVEIDGLDIYDGADDLEFISNREDGSEEAVNVNQTYNRLNFIGLPSLENSISFKSRDKFEITNSNFENIGITITPTYSGGKDIKVSNANITGGQRSLLISPAGDNNVYINDITSKNASSEGVYILSTTGLVVANNLNIENAGSIGFRIRGSDYYLKASSSSITGSSGRGVYLQNDGVSTNEYSFNGLLSRNNGTTNIDIELGITQVSLSFSL